MTIDFLILLLVTIFNLILGFAVFSKGRTYMTNICFMLFVIANSAWSIANYASYRTFDSTLILWLVRMVMYFAVLQAYSFYTLTYVFPHADVNLPKWWKYLYSPISLITAFLTLTPLVIRSVNIQPDQTISPVVGPGMALFAIVAVGSVLTGILTIFRKMRRTQGVEKVQFKYLLMGVSLMFICILVFNFLFSIILNNTSLIPLSAVFTLPFVFLTSIAIYKHKFFDISLLVARTISYSLLTFILISIYATLLYLSTTIIFDEKLSTQRFILSTALAILLVYTFPLFQRVLERITDRLFYKNRYDTNTLLANLSRVMASTINLEELTSKTVQILVTEAKISNASIILLENSQIYFKQTTNNNHNSSSITYEQAKQLIGKGNKNRIFEHELENKQKKIMRQLDINAVIPLSTKDEKLGILILAEKSSGDIYSEQDIKLFNILAPELSIAIQNAKAFQQISTFNITLKEEVKRATEDLRQANRRLKVLDRLKDEFVSIASHELRTPMTAIKSYLWMILNKADEKDHLTDKTKQYIERAYVSTERLINLVNDMLDVSRIEAGQIQLKLTSVQIRKIAEEVVHEVAAKAQERQIEVTVDNETNASAYADPDKIHQVIINLVGNALKFTPPNGKITIKVSQKDTMIITQVIDTGQGIGKQDLQKLFSKFGRLENSYVSMAESGGTGLGLYISKQLINLHNGEIFVESEVGKGSTFSFSLPVDKTTATQ